MRIIIPEELPIDTEDFTHEELSECLKSFKYNKACGLDNIPAEVWKSHNLDRELLDFCNRTIVPMGTSHHSGQPVLLSLSLRQAI